jgi:hypothetical protein
MKRLLIAIILTLAPLALLISCSSKNSPTSSSGGNTGTSPTATHTAILVSPTVTKTPVCSTFFSFGKNTLGSGPLAPSGGILVANKFSLSVAGNLFRLNVYVEPVPTPGNIQMAVYTDNAGAPQSLVAQSTVQAAAAGWNVLDVPQTILAPGNYWIAVTSSNGVNLSNQTGATGDVRYINAGPGSLPVNFSGSTSADWNFSMYADYCAIPGSPTPIPTPSFTPTITPTITLTATPTQTAACSTPFNFGRNYIGGHTEEIDNGTAASKFTMPVGGVVSELHVYVSGNTGTSVKMGLYNDSASTPGSLIVGSGTQVVVSGWNNFAVAGTFIPAGTYWIAAGSLAGSNGPQFAADTALDNSDANDGYIAGSLIPTGNFSGSGPFQFSLSVYADYCVPGSSPTPILSPTKTFTPTNTPTHTATPTETVALSCVGSYSFGKNYLLGSVGLFNAGNSFAGHYTLPVDGTVKTLHVYVPGATGENISMGIYTNVSGHPGTLLSQSNSQAAITGWNSLSIPATQLAAGTYWIALTTDSSGVSLSNDNGNDLSDGYFGSGSPGALPSSFGGSGPLGYSFSYYADYCVTSGSPTPLPSVTWTPTLTYTLTATPTITQTPSCSAPTSFGFSAVSTPSNFGGGYFFGVKTVMSTASKVVALNAYISSVPSATDVRMALYTDNAGAPGTLLTQSNSQSVTVGWNKFPVPATNLLSAPATLWIALVHDNYGSGLGLEANANSGANLGYFASAGFGNFPSTAPSGSSQDYTFSFYASKCP